MRNLVVAEWLLSRYTTKVCAVSIIGDLIEDRHESGSIGFWRALFAILWCFVWRRTLAFAVAVVFGLICFDFLHNLMYSVHATHLPSGQSRILLDCICLASILLSFGMAYTAVRYGVKDTFAQQVIALWGLTSILSAYWWMPVVMVAVTILGVSLMLRSFFSEPTRQALLAVVVALSFAVAVYWLACFFAQNLAGSHVPVFNNLAFYVFVLGLALQPTVYSRVHDMFWPSMRTGASLS